MSLKVNEIYYSVQGESTHVGLPCIFIRLTYCNLRCTYCDTEYAFFEGEDMEIPEIMDRIKQWNCNLVEVPGGEPLFQAECFHRPLPIRLRQRARQRARQRVHLLKKKN